MSNPFQEQLLKAGLTTEKKIKSQNQAKRKKSKQQNKSKVKEVDENKLLVQKAEEEKRQRDRELNQKKEEALKQKAIVAQIKQLIEMNKADLSKGELIYNFEDNNVIKRIYVTEILHQKISNGQFAIVQLDQTYHVVPSVVAIKIKTRDPSYIIVLNDSKTTEEIDDEYADYKIPDDLLW